ncbi:MAG: protein kinase [Planctomycetota bacterium]
MSASSFADRSEPGGDADDALLADLFDDLLQQVLDGETPDLAQLLPDRPDLQPRVRATFDLACSVAGRREAGRPVLGGYEIVRELGRGGMGTVYLARHEALQREVAIKVLPQSLALSPRARRRFLDEARSLARLRHDHIVHIHRIVDHSEMLAFEMEYVEGPSLQHLLIELRKHGPRPLPHHLEEVLGPHVGAAEFRSTVEYFVKLGIAIARALAEVHRRGLVHRDVKPSNILLRKDGTPVLADFGLARDGDLAVTQTIQFAGTPIYAAPERLRDGDLDLDGRADVYSLGVTLYEAITLSPPYQGRSTQEVLRRIENGDLVPLRRRAPHVSRDLQTVLQKAMDADPRHRYATAGDFADDLERLLSLQPVHARPKGPARRLWLAMRRQRRPLLGGLVGALLVTLGLWPWFGTAEAAAAARLRTARHVQQAHRLLLEPGCIDLANRRSLHGHSVGRQETALPEQVAALRRVLEQYDLAAAESPDDARVQQERAVLATALWLRTASPSKGTDIEAARGSPEFRAAAAGLMPATRRGAELLIGGHDALTRGDDDAAATPQDRFALGLLAALTGEAAMCEGAWSGLDATGFEHPLLDAGLGLLAASEGNPERAYPRLFHATRSFPGSSVLTFELADAALATGDPQLAREWLRDAAAAADADAGTGASQGAALEPRRLRLEADLLAADGARQDAELRYREILQRWPDDATARQRLATLAILRGDLQRARQHLQRIVAQWPDHARARLDLARLALRQAEPARYLEQARQALTRLRTADGSSSERAVLAEILRLGGLTPWIAEGGATADPGVVDWRRAEAPDPPWTSPAAAERVAAALQLLATYDGAAGDAPPLVGAMRGIYAVAAAHGNTLRPAPLLGRLVLAAAAPWALHPDLHYFASLLLMPFQRSLGTPLQTVAIERLVPHVDVAGRTLLTTALTTLGAVDGTEDLLLGIAPLNDLPTPGRVEIRSAADGALLGALHAPDSNSIYGYAVCDLGDLDRDGYPDFAVGAPLRVRAPELSGKVHVHSGRDRAELYTLRDEAVGFGVALANLGDVDGDGCADFAVGTSPELRNSTAQGAAAVFSGRSGARLYTLHGDRAGAWFGAALVATDDLDRDGCRDLLVGGNHGDAPGLVRAHSGRDGRLLYVLEPEPDAYDFGRVLASIDDVDGDGIGDLAVAAPEAQMQRPRPGRVHLFSGRSGRRLTVLVGDHPGDVFGMGLCALPDWRGDHAAALAVRAARRGPTGTGYVRIFGLRPLRPLQTFFSPTGAPAFGQAMAAVGDHDGLGRPRLALPLHRPDLDAIATLRYTLDQK